VSDDGNPVLRERTLNPMASTATGEPITKPRGLLRLDFAPVAFENRRRWPSTALQNLVEHYGHARWDLRRLPPQQQATLSHPNVHLVVEFGQGMRLGRAPWPLRATVAGTGPGVWGQIQGWWVLSALPPAGSSLA
jgi:hypothetical protein